MDKLRLLTAFSIVGILALGSPGFAQGEQGGLGGGGFGGGGFGGAAGQGGRQQELYDRSTRAIEQAIRRYITNEPIRNILTPEGFSEWPLDLKIGQVVIAEASSDAFDPMLEIADAKEVVLASNDDRYPGDQRPLLLWRCDRDGAYSIRARSFRDKAGGQFFIRFNIYDSMDVTPGAESTMDVDNEKVLVRTQMKAGQVLRLSTTRVDEKHVWASIGQTISPIGLPDIDLAYPLRNVVRDAIVAPVDGDYYTLLIPMGAGKLEVGAMAVPTVPLTRTSDVATAKSKINSPSLWSLSVKKGEVIEVAAPDIYYNSTIIVSERPDVSKNDLTKPEQNPFFPKTKKQEDEKGPALTQLPGRARDGRVFVFAAHRDADVWIATNGLGKEGDFTLTVKPAAMIYEKQNAHRLIIAKTDYWYFDAVAGEVMTFNSTAAQFAQHITLLGPDFGAISNAQAAPDQTKIPRDLIVSKSGRYMFAVSAIGDGGGGDYTLTRETFQPKAFSKSAPAQGEMKDSGVQVLKFTAKPDEPLLVRWNSNSWNYSINIRNDQGENVNLPMTQVDVNNKYGILKVQEPTTFLIVLKSTGPPSRYVITLSDLPK